MAMNQFGIGMIFKGVDGVSPVAKRIGSSLFGMRQKAEMSMAGMNRAMTGAVVGFKAMQAGFGLTSMVTNMAEAAGDYEEQLAAIQGRTGSTTEEMKKLSDASMDAAMATQFSPTEVVKGLSDMSTAGLQVNEMLASLRPALDLAATSVGQLGVVDAANAIVGTVKSMNMSLSETADVTDKLFKITQITNFQARDFGTALSRATVAGNAYNQTLDDTLITMGLLRNLNIEASVASTSLREAFRRLATDQKAQQAITRHGVKIYEERTGKTRSFLDVMTDLEEKTRDLTDKERARVAVMGFGVRGMAAFNAVANAQATAMINGVEVSLKGADAINFLREQMEDSAGAAEKMRLKLLETYKGQQKLIQGSKEAVKIALGEAATRLMKPISAAIFAVYSGLANFFKAIPVGARQAILGILSAFGALIASAGAVVAFSAAMNLLGLSFGGVLFTLGKFVLFMGPAMLLIGGMAATIAAVVKAFRSNTGGVLDWLGRWAEKVKIIWIGVNDLISDKAVLSEKTVARMKKSGNEGLIPVIRGIAEWVKRLQIFWDGLKDGWLQAIDELQPKIEILKNTFGGILDRFLYDGAGPAESMNTWEKAGTAAGKSIGRLGGMFIDWLNESAPMIENMLMGLKGITAADVKSGIEGLVSSFRDLVDALNRVVGLLRVIANLFDVVGSGIGEGFAALSVDFQRATGQISFEQWQEIQRQGFKEFDRSREELSNAWGMLTTGENPATEAIRRRNAEMEDMLRRHRQIQEWVDTPASQWTKTARSFEAAPQAMREEYVGEMNRLADAINKLAKRPMVAKVKIDEIGKSSIAYEQAEADRELFEGGMSVPTY